MLADVICSWKITSFMVLDGLTSFLRLKDVTNTYTMHNKFSNFLGFASFLCSSLCSADQF